MKTATTLVVTIIAMLCGTQGAFAQYGDPTRLARKPAELGNVSFPVTCGPAAQPQFNHAMALFHSFWYPQSIQAFTELAAKPPECAMAHWGIALSILRNPLGGYPMSPKDWKEGWSAVEKAKSIGAKTERERDYIAAMEALYKDADKRELRERQLAYETAMEQVYLRHPDDREAAVLYALALNMTALPTDKTYANQLRAATILEKVFAAQPNHPGAAHYLIHSYDYPPIANKGLHAARRFADIAPAAPHALHMPSHIFTRLGYWQDSIRTNSAAAEVAHAAAAKKESGMAGAEGLHAMDYMMYAYLQGAQDGEAKRLLDRVRAFRTSDNPGRIVPSYAFAARPARYAIERGQCAEAAHLTLYPSEHDFPWASWPQAEAVLVYARALGSARSGDSTGARREIERLKALREALITAKQGYWAGQTEIQIKAASAWVARVQGRDKEALSLMREAADMEDATEKHIVTPGHLLPAREMLGDLLLESGQAALALKEFEASGGKEPNRFRGLYGAARAAELSGDREKARTYYAKLVALAERADSARLDLRQAKAYLARR
ncbi:MAG: tetratricopeptide repeat protein [Betaproteobacteria bacterium]